MPGTFSPPPQVSDPDMHHGTCVTHVPWCKLGSLTSGFFWNWWRGKRSRHSRRMHNPQFYVSGKRPVVYENTVGSHYKIIKSHQWKLLAVLCEHTNILYTPQEIHPCMCGKGMYSEPLGTTKLDHDIMRLECDSVQRILGWELLN